MIACDRHQNKVEATWDLEGGRKRADSEVDLLASPRVIRLQLCEECVADLIAWREQEPPRA